jgi:hypothetical protein
MPARGIITLTTAPAGSGKTFRRGPHFLLNYLLTQTHASHWSNLPLFPEKIAEEAAKRTGRPLEEFIDRIKLIPPEVCDQWRSGDSGPWEFFASIDLQDAHLALDEFHEFCGANTPPALREKYRVWFGQIRHRGATIEIISQDPDKIGKEVERECANRLALVNNEDRRDPYFRILFGDWYELRAKFFTGQYIASVWEVEYRKANGKWVEEDKRVFWLDKTYFPFYDSYSKPTDSAVKGEASKREFEKRTRLGLIGWFIKNNWPRLVWKGAIYGFVVWLLCGGLVWLMLQAVSVINHRVISQLNRAAVGDLGGVQTIHSTTTSIKGVTHPSALPRPQMIEDARKTEAPTTMQALDIQKQQASQYYNELQEERSKSAELERTLAETQAKLKKNSLIVCLTPDSMTLSDGQSYRVGERVDSGLYAGKLVKAIHWNRRRVEFEDGTLVGLAVVEDGAPRSVNGDGGMQQAGRSAGPATTQAGLPRPVRGPE